MNNEEFQDKYDEVFQELKEEKMEWDFDDFLEKAEGIDARTPVRSISSKNKYSFLWMAASMAFLLGLGYLMYHYNSKPYDESMLVHEIMKQKPEIELENTVQEEIFIVEDSLRVKKDTVNTSETTGYQSEEKILNQILPKRARLKKPIRPRYASISQPKPTAQVPTPNLEEGYHSEYVIINGKKVESEAQAIEVTKKALTSFASNVNITVQQAQVVENLVVEF